MIVEIINGPTVNYTEKSSSPFDKSAKISSSHVYFADKISGALSEQKSEKKNSCPVANFLFPYSLKYRLGPVGVSVDLFRSPTFFLRKLFISFSIHVGDGPHFLYCLPPVSLSRPPSVLNLFFFYRAHSCVLRKKNEKKKDSHENENFNKIFQKIRIQRLNFALHP